jgi:hypothetical protein
VGAPVPGSSRIETSDTLAGGGGPVGLLDCPAHWWLIQESLLARRSWVTLTSTQSLGVGREVSLHRRSELLGGGPQGGDRDRCQTAAGEFGVGLDPEIVGALRELQMRSCRSTSAAWINVTASPARCMIAEGSGDSGVARCDLNRSTTSGPTTPVTTTPTAAITKLVTTTHGGPSTSTAPLPLLRFAAKKDTAGADPSRRTWDPRNWELCRSSLPGDLLPRRSAR